MKKQPVRERLIQTATDLFYHQGYNRTGINEILEKSGVAKASMYQHFRSKEEIGVEFLKEKQVEMNQQLGEYLDQTPPGLERLTALFDFLLLFYNHKGFRGCWCLNTLAEVSTDDNNLLNEIHRQKKELRSFMHVLAKENLPEENENEVGDALYLLFEAALAESFVHRSDWPIKKGKLLAERLFS